jgi:uncharacterized membrane protein (UPF0127 family)
MRLASSPRRPILRLAPLLLIPLALIAYLLWPRGNAQGATRCIASEFQFPSGVKPVPFACGTLTLSDSAKSVQIPVEIAETPEETSRGLMYRTSLDAGAGMVFLFGAKTRTGFWMKNTLIPLSIAFFDDRGVINDILDMEPCLAAVDCPSYYPKNDYVGALEVNKGFFAKKGIRTGASVSLERKADDAKGKK